MQIKIRRSVVNMLGLLTVFIQIYRYTFDLMTNFVLEIGVGCFALMMALNIKGLGVIILEFARALINRLNNDKDKTNAK